MTDATEELPQSAMMLTHPEWQDLAEICQQFLLATSWVEVPQEEHRQTYHPDAEAQILPLQQRRVLAQRIIDATK